MRARIDDREVDSELVSIQEPKFGRTVTDRSTTRLILTIPRVEFIEKVGPFYTEYADDDLSYGEDAGSIDLKLRALGWPPLNTLWNEHAEELRDFVLYNAHAIMGELFQARAKGVRKYYVFRVDSARVEREQILLFSQAVIW